MSLPASWDRHGPPNAPVLVLANSLGTNLSMWDEHLPVLCERFSVLRYEHPGHGGTAPPDPLPTSIADLAAPVLELLDHLGVARASFCGLSLGGMVCAWIAAHHPERVDRLALLCTAAHLPPPEAWQEGAAVVRRDGPASLTDTLVGMWFTPEFTAAHPETGERVAAMLSAVDREGYAACCEAIGAMDLRPDLASIVAPTLVLAGARDPVTPPAMALELQAGIPGAALTVVPGVSHFAAIERPDAVRAALVEHLIGESLDRGRAQRRAVLGDAHVQRSEGARSALSGPFIDFLTRYAWGDVWTRPGLDRATRSAITLGILCALGRAEELELHVRAARRNGLTPAEIGEVLLHSAVYAGLPAGNAAFRIAERVLADESPRDQPDGAPGQPDGPEQDGSGPGD